MFSEIFVKYFLNFLKILYRFKFKKKILIFKFILKKKLDR